MSREADEEILNIDTSLNIRDTGGVFQQNILVPPGTLLTNTNIILPLTDGTSGQVLAKGSGNSTEWKNFINFSDIWIIQDIRPSGVNGGTGFSVGSWSTRVLNNLVNPSGTNNDVTLNSNQLTIQDGTYYIYAECPGNNVNRHKAKLRNFTDNLDILIGTSEYNIIRAQTSSIVQGILTVIGGPKIYEFQHRSSRTQVNTGSGEAIGFGASEVYTSVFIKKIF